MVSVSKYPLPTGTIESPNFGDIREANEINKTGRHYYIWIVCPQCNNGHWIFISKGKPITTTSLCLRCYRGYPLGRNNKQPLSTGTINKPNFGDIRHPKELNLTGTTYLIWYPCPQCNNGHWTLYPHHKPKIKLCGHCASKNKSNTNNSFYGKRHTKESKDKISNSHLLMRNYPLPVGTITDPLFGDIRSVKDLKINADGFRIWLPCPNCNKGHWSPYSSNKSKARRCRACGNIGNVASIETKAKLSKIQKAKWSDLVYKEEMLNKQRANMNIKPNKPEQKLISILDMIEPNKWQYVGDWKLVIGGLNPDFWNGDHKLIEMFGDWWHSPKRAIRWTATELGKVMHFNAYGYKTLIIWEHELKQPELVIKKITQFVGEKQNGH